MIQANTVITGDSLTVLRDMEADSVDMVITDPPYGIDPGCAAWPLHPAVWFRPIPQKYLPPRRRGERREGVLRSCLHPSSASDFSEMGPAVPVNGISIPLCLSAKSNQTGPFHLIILSCSEGELKEFR